MSAPFKSFVHYLTSFFTPEVSDRHCPCWDHIQSCGSSRMSLCFSSLFAFPHWTDFAPIRKDSWHLTEDTCPLRRMTYTHDALALAHPPSHRSETFLDRCMSRFGQPCLHAPFSLIHFTEPTSVGPTWRNCFRISYSSNKSRCTLPDWAQKPPKQKIAQRKRKGG